MKKLYYFLAMCFSIFSVNAYSQCPATITFTNGNLQTVCSGSAFNLDASIAGAGTPTGSFYYSWLKNGIPVAAPSVTKAPLSISSVSVSDAGTYTFRVVDSTSGLAASCYKESAITLAVNVPVVAGTISTSQTICSGATPVALTGTSSTGGAGAKYYRWFSSTTSAAGPWTPVSGYSSSTTGFAPVALTTTTYYIRRDSSGICPGVYTTPVTITVNPAVDAGVIGAAQMICYNTSPAGLTSLTQASGGTGTYSYTWESSTNGGSSWNTIAGATDATYAPGALTASTQFRRKVTAGGCSASTVAVTITVNPAVVAGSISSAQTICSGVTPVALMGTASAGGSGTRYYRWFSSTTSSSGPWTPAGAYSSSASGFAPGVLTATTHYIRKDSVGICLGTYTNVVTITVSPSVTAGSIGAAQTICYNMVPAAFISLTQPTGGTGIYSYTWESSTNGGSSWSAIAGATNMNYTSGALTTTTQFRRTVTSGCSPASTGPITITVNPALSAGTIGSDQIICSGATPSVINVLTPQDGGTGTYTYQWESSPSSSGPWTNISSATNPIYTPQALSVSTSYRRKVTSGFCPVEASNAVAITVTPSVSPAVSISPAGTVSICAGEPVLFTATSMNGGTSPIITWKINGVSVSSGTSATFTPLISLATGDQISATLTSDIACVTSNNVVSNIATMNVTATVISSVGVSSYPSGPICQGTSVTFTAASVNGGTAPTYVWFINGTALGAASGSAVTFTSSTLSNGDVVTVQMTSNSGCAILPNAMSSPITMTTNPNLPVSVALTSDKGSTICTGESVTFTAIPTNGGGKASYLWKVNGVSQSVSTSVFTTSTLRNNDVIEVTLTSSEACVVGNPVASNPISMTVNPALAVTVTLDNPKVMCSGDPISFVAKVTNGGSNPIYQWYVGNDLQATTGSTFTTSTLKDGDIVGVKVSSNEVCIIGSSAKAQAVANMFSATCANIATISGKVFNDENNNGVMDIGEQGMNGVKVLLDGARIAFTDTSGVYEFFVLENASYNLDVILPNESYVRTLPSASYSIAVGSGGSINSGNNFGLYLQQVSDLSVMLVAAAARPGFVTSYTVLYSNLGKVLLNGKIKLSYPAGLIFTGSSLANFTHDDQQHTIEVPYTNLAKGTINVWNVAFNVPVAMPLNTVLESKVEGFVNGVTDVQLANNTDMESVIVRGSYDPNDKSVFPVGVEEAGFVEKETSLTYTIRFQNTGNAEAFTVIVRDTLDEDLDITSLEMLGASHEYILSAKGRALAWTFNNINLPDKNTNEALSHGFIKYRVKQNSNLPIGTEIKNKAGIYFDFNDPIITNETLNTIGENLVSSTLPKASNKSIIVYPNPATTELYFAGMESSFDYEITDLTGTQLMAGKSEGNLNISTIERGVYFIKITTNGGVYVNKIVKE